MDGTFRPRCPAPSALVEPVRVGEGVTPGRARGPGWRRTTPGLYVPSHVAPSVEQRILEQSRRLPEGGAVGGWASLRLHGAAYFDGVRGREPLAVPLVVPHEAPRLRPLPGSRVVRTRRPVPVVSRYAVPCVAPAAAVVAEASDAPDLGAAVTVLDMALAARVVTHDDVRRELAERGGQRGVARVRRALALADERSRSPQESWLRLVWVLLARLPPPRCNWLVADADGRVVGSPDLLSLELGLVAEFEGATHLHAASRRSDVRREEAFEAVGLEVVTVVGRHRGDEAEVAERLRAAARRAQAAARPQTWSARPYRLP
ncbi:hypothetical protein [Nocardioides aequoreus]|uniref:hypothetical protein n=1 Tax=Nocardioides aequoreus TaxID=397278 RepID=UPI00068DB438|nr:hypothetical protein [Nocardioides aequoreus]